MNDHTQTDQPDDDKISSLYKQGSVETPADHINEKIRYQARQPSGNVLNFPFRELFSFITSSRSLAVAAILVIGVSIILQIQFEHPEEIMMPKTEHYSGNGLIFDKQGIENHDVMHEQSAANADDGSITPQSTITNAVPETPKPAIKAKKMPAKPNLKYDIQQHENNRQKQLESRRALEKRAEEQQDRSKRRLTEMTLQSAPATPQAVIAESSTTDRCSALTHAACLSSSSCVLDDTNSELTCRSAINHCERDFSQTNDRADRCQQRELCEYTIGLCECDPDGSCECIDNTPPSCKLIQMEAE